MFDHGNFHCISEGALPNITLQPGGQECQRDGTSWMALDGKDERLLSWAQKGICLVASLASAVLRDPFNVNTIPRYLHSLTDSSVAKTTHFYIEFLVLVWFYWKWQPCSYYCWLVGHWWYSMYLANRFSDLWNLWGVSVSSTKSSANSD